MTWYMSMCLRYICMYEYESIQAPPGLPRYLVDIEYRDS